MRAAHGVKLCVFDCDGTLVDSQHSIIAAMHAAFDAQALPRPDREAVRRVVGLSLLEALTALLPGAEAGVHAAVSDSYREAFRARRHPASAGDTLFPGVVAALRRLEETGWLLGVATGKGRRGLVGTLRTHGLEDLFVTLQTADQAPGKPRPDMLLRAMAETGAAADRTVMVGDTTFDVQMALRAGTMAVGVAWGYHELGELEAAGAHSLVHVFDALPEAVERLIGGAS